MNRIKSFLSSPQGRRVIDQGARAASRRSGRAGGGIPGGTGSPAGGGMAGGGMDGHRGGGLQRGGGLLSRLLRR